MKTKLVILIFLTFSTIFTVKEGIGQTTTTPSDPLRIADFYKESNTVIGSLFTSRNDLVGSRYLYTDWVMGEAIDSAGRKHISLMNFDKITQSLYIKLPDLSNDKALVVDKSQIRSVHFSDDNLSYHLEKVPSLKNDFLYNQLLTGAKYSLYSSIETKFIPSDYTTKGIISSGNMYNEYKDEITYYVIFANGSAHQISLKWKGIKKVFSIEKTRLNEFLKTKAEFPVNENFLVNLVTYLNQ